MESKRRFLEETAHKYSMMWKRAFVYIFGLFIVVLSFAGEIWNISLLVAEERKHLLLRNCAINFLTARLKNR